MRVSKYLLAKVKTEQGSFFAYVQDVATGGIGMTCNRDLGINTKLEITVNVPNRKNIEILGYPVWIRDLPVIARNKYIYGIKVPNPPEDYSEYVEELLRYEYERRSHPRYSDMLVIKSDDVLDLLDAATSDVSAKGLYVRTSRLLVRGQQIEMQLIGSDLADPITCLVEIANSFTCQDDNLDHPYGAGVRIISFSKESAGRFSQYIKQLEELYKFHWPDGKAPEGVQPSEVEVGTDNL
ncbi:MAG: PilZ domain-containing protein [Candidatus Alcyoniella australis]|nr:PilZ domain-containing protein [Candidatus Alcyoniella australis]